MSEKTSPHTFQAEVQQLLDIVINSLYTDREIFVRELVSNASDALEKLKLLKLTEGNVFEPEKELEIQITTDDQARTITIADSGIGMTREELIENLGTIAHSGSRAFMQSLSQDNAAANVIGKFGVGFYSAFMPAKQVRVYTHSWRPDGEHLCWSSDGKTGYTIEEAPGQSRGCRIVIELREGEEYDNFCKDWKLKEILTRYSNFVSFPISLNGERVNKVEALWLKSKSEIKDEQYKEFYQFIGHAFDDPRYRLHFNSEVPLSINALVFVPTENSERFGMGQMEPGVALYCRRVLIDHHPKGLLPEWLRFLKGVIDSDDLPLNISRETMQDSALIKKLNDVITGKFLKFLDSSAADNAEQYTEFYKSFSRFLKEGIATDYQHRNALAKLLRFESSMTEKGKLTSLDEYMTRAKDGQDCIYYQIAPSREAVESGPYLEGFKARGLEVIYLYETIDDYVCSSLREYQGKKLVAVEAEDVKLDEHVAPDAGEPLSKEDSEWLCNWLKELYGEAAEDVRTSTRLVESPAAALTTDRSGSPQFRAMMRAMNQDAPPAKVILEINPRHALIKKLAAAREARPEVAKLVARQVMDNALIAAGLLEDPREVVQRMYALMEEALAK